MYSMFQLNSCTVFKNAQPHSKKKWTALAFIVSLSPLMLRELKWSYDISVLADPVRKYYYREKGIKGRRSLIIEIFASSWTDARKTISYISKMSKRKFTFLHRMRVFQDIRSEKFNISFQTICSKDFLIACTSNSTTILSFSTYGEDDLEFALREFKTALKPYKGIKHLIGQADVLLPNSIFGYREASKKIYSPFYI